MTVPKSKRDANKKWDAANMTIVGCRVTKDKAAQFRSACLNAGTNPNAVLLACVNKFIADHGVSDADLVQGTDPGQGVPAGESRVPGSGWVTHSPNSAEEKPD